MRVDDRFAIQGHGTVLIGQATGEPRRGMVVRGPGGGAGWPVLIVERRVVLGPAWAPGETSGVLIEVGLREAPRVGEVVTMAPPLDGEAGRLSRAVEADDPASIRRMARLVIASQAIKACFIARTEAEQRSLLGEALERAEIAGLSIP